MCTAIVCFVHKAYSEWALFLSRALYPRAAREYFINSHFLSHTRVFTHAGTKSYLFASWLHTSSASNVIHHSKPFYHRTLFVALVLARTQRKKIKISRPIFQRHFLLLGEKLPESREVLCALCLLQLDAMETRPTPPFLSMTRLFFVYALKIHYLDRLMQ